MASGVMARDGNNIPRSAMYTAATWKWAGMPCAEITTPDGSDALFGIVNVYMKLYRFINPKKYSLHHTLLHRHAMINYLMETAQCPQVIEVAAGFSPRGADISNDSGVNYYEVDLEDVVVLKRNQLAKSEQGRAVINRENFNQLAFDILKMNFSAVFPAKKSFVITEGLMMYFARDEQLSVWRSIAQLIKDNDGEYVFDYIPLDIEPECSWLGKMLEKIIEWSGGDGQGYCYDSRTRWDIRDDLLTAGFAEVEVLESNTKATEWNLPCSDVRTHVVVYRCR